MSEPYLVNPKRGNPWTIVAYPKRKAKLWRQAKSGRFGARKRKNPLSAARRRKLSRVMKKAKSLRSKGLSPREAMRKAWRTNDGGELVMHMNKRNKKGRFMRRKAHSGKKRRNPVSFHANRRSRRKHCRRTRRNPGMAGVFGAALPTKDMALEVAKLALWAAGSGIVSAQLTDLAGRYVAQAGTPMGRNAVRVGVALVLASLTDKYVGRKEALAVGIGAIAPVANELAGQFLPKLGLGIGGLLGLDGDGMGVYAPGGGENRLAVYAPASAANVGSDDDEAGAF